MEPVDENEAAGLLTAREAATLKGVHINAVYHARAAGTLRAVVVLGRVAFRRGDVDAWQVTGAGGDRRSAAYRQAAKKEPKNDEKSESTE